MDSFADGSNATFCLSRMQPSASKQATWHKLNRVDGYEENREGGKGERKKKEH